MSITLATEEDSSMQPRRWTRDEFHRMAEAGIFEDNERLELIDGEVYRKTSQQTKVDGEMNRKMSPQSERHASAIILTATGLTKVFGDIAYVRQQLPITLSNDSEPEPDVAVVKGLCSDYIDHPTAADVLLVVEVSDTSLVRDRIKKAAIYARAGIADYWLINLNNRTLEVRRHPGPNPDARGEFAYRSLTVYTEDETISPLTAVSNVSLRVTDLFPPQPGSIPFEKKE